MGRNKDQGTQLETRIVNESLARRLDATRAANGLPGRDVDIRLTDGRLVVVESKARQSLSLHPTLKDTVAEWGGASELQAVVWHRLVKKPGNSRRTAAGPTLAALPLTQFLDLLAEVDRS